MRDYIAKEYCQGRVSELENLNKYMTSKEGMRRINSYEKYYEKKRKIKENIKQKNVLILVINALHMLTLRVFYERLLVKLKYYFALKG